MANKNLFQSASSKAPEADTTNAAGGRAYSLSTKSALATLAVCGTFADGYYEKGSDQLTRMKGLLDNEAVTPKFAAQLAVYAREKGHMKDMPAFICAWLTTQGEPGRAMLKRIFPTIIGNGRMLRNFVQILRSGVLGRKSLGSSPKNLVRQYLDRAPVSKLFRDSVGNDPSLLDIVKMVHPKPGTDEKRAFYGYLLGRDHSVDHLPDFIREFEQFKALSHGENGNAEQFAAMTPPDVEFRMLTSLPLTKDHWKQIARKGWWHQTRMNLNSYAKHGVFEDKEMVQLICEKLTDQEAIEKARVFPYHLYVAYLATTGGISTGRRYYGYGAKPEAQADLPEAVLEALQAALDIAIDSTPTFDCGSVLVLSDTSGSMHSPITGHRDGATSVVRMVDVAGLFGAQVFKKNPGSKLWGFDDKLHQFRINRRDSVISIAEKFPAQSGGTNYSLGLQQALADGYHPDLVVYFGDMQSWIDTPGHRSRDFYGGYYDSAGGTSTMELWKQLQRKNPKSKAVFVNLAGHGDSQISEDGRGMNVAGWSQAVFEQIQRFVAGDTDPEGWVRSIESIDLDELRK